LGVDIAVCLDECVALPAEKKYIEESIELTTRWAKRSFESWKKIKNNKSLLFCVIQGGLDEKLRTKSLNDLKQIGDWDGYNIGGLSVGESAKEMYQVLDWLQPLLPENRSHYLMGVGYPDNILQAVKRGIDMFDCVIPTREGRHGRLFVWNLDKKTKLTSAILLKKNFYKTINIYNSNFKTDQISINIHSSQEVLKNLSRGYLHHLFKLNEPLGLRLASLNNLEFYLTLMKFIRQEIKKGNL
jgi:queuine tRNA-ribosyltransferase